MLKKYSFILLAISVSIFAANCTKPNEDKSDTMALKHFKQRIKEKASNYKQRPVIIVAFGDSVTMGATKMNTFDFENVYHAQLKKMLEKKYPKTVFSVINSGVGGEKAPDGLKRLNRDVIKYTPDLVIIGFALNDASAGVAGLPKYKKSLKATIEKIRKKTQADIILLTPNFMCTADNDNVSKSHRKLKLPENFSKLQNEGVLKLYAKTVKDVGKEYSIPVADVYNAWEKLAKQGVDTNALLDNGLNHPKGKAHSITAQLIFKRIDPKYKVDLSEFTK